MAEFPSGRTRATEAVKRLRTFPPRLWGLARDRRVPLRAKAVLVLLALYFVNPVDLIPDFVPGIGYLDDALIAAGLLALAARMVPGEVWREYFAPEIGPTLERDPPGTGTGET